MVVINPIPGQEEENAKYLERKNIAIWIKKDSDVDSIITDLLSNPEKLNEMKKNTYSLAHKHSTLDICKILLD